MHRSEVVIYKYPAKLKIFLGNQRERLQYRADSNLKSRKNSAFTLIYFI